jgi:hypothetical protein
VVRLGLKKVVNKAHGRYLPLRGDFVKSVLEAIKSLREVRPADPTLCIRLEHIDQGRLYSFNEMRQDAANHKHSRTRTYALTLALLRRIPNI